MRQGAAVLGLSLLLAPALSFAQGTSHGSNYLPNCPNALVSASGDCVTIGSGIILSGNVLTASGGSGGSSGPIARQLEVSTPGGAPLTTTPYPVMLYAERAGTIRNARVAMLAASGANFQYVVHIVHNGTDTPVTGLNNVGVCDGESGCTAAQLGTYASPNLATATGANTYAVGDYVYFSFNTVGGTFTSVTAHLGVTD